MLESLAIKNVALIRNAMIAFDRGFNCLSGETGSGKSLIIDSLSLLLGEKADKTLISYGEDNAYVEAVFNTENKYVLDAMEDFGLDRENTIVISRKITADGKNECRVNGKVFTLSMLKKITLPMMDLHGQFQHQSLIKVQNHLTYLDDFAGKRVSELKQEFVNLHGKYVEINEELKSFSEDDNERAKLIDLYRYQIDEIENAAFKIGEDQELRDFHTMVCNGEKIADAINNSINILEGDSYIGGVVDGVSKLTSNLTAATRFTDKISELAERTHSVQIEVKDILDTLYTLKEELVFDEREVAEKESRLDMFNSFTKKYGKTIEDINIYLEKIKIEYDKLSNSEEYVDGLKKKKADLVNQLTYVGGLLSDERKIVAKSLECKIEAELHDLGMKNAVFAVQFTPRQLLLTDNLGLDEVEFMFSANKGIPVRPLSKIASGGEMSRLMLAIKTIVADKDFIDTMIFDEIDSGVSGNIANVLAQKMFNISKGRQIITVTHLPQICAMADSNFYISKASTENTTQTNIETLTLENKIKEVARLTGGNLSELALSHAKELIDFANDFKVE